MQCTSFATQWIEKSADYEKDFLGAAQHQQQQQQQQQHRLDEEKREKKTATIWHLIFTVYTLR